MENHVWLWWLKQFVQVKYPYQFTFKCLSEQSLLLPLLGSPFLPYWSWVTSLKYLEDQVNNTFNFEVLHIGFCMFSWYIFILQVVPNSRSRSQMGETTDGGLYEIFQQDFGPVGSPSFENARDNFIISSAGYAVASLILQPKDRHNGNLLFDKYALLFLHIFKNILYCNFSSNNIQQIRTYHCYHDKLNRLPSSDISHCTTPKILLARNISWKINIQEYLYNRWPI